ncbi:RmlC-like cupin domain-containing protein [Zychaea mexicana]|uniref:RmlC-like cupin domain-containing protein n=1 Tax=Zychaea mexicana TaxID=64656 RepID=UPI0022FEC0AF|nr:RmlC-like cupin domain-containing protein [Zychaea mexicana]KAI9497286.1 RmlC-like cupin domain-containing protein [Zychaea mexicana]
MAEDKLGFLKNYPDINAEPLWTVMEAMVPPIPSPKSVPHVWEYQKMRPALIESGKRIKAEEAERRVLMLINPTMKAPCTTDTLYAGLQLINPGEVAPAHRHCAFALRFIIEGERGFTAVEGEKITMERGDVILTPPWQWHDHGHEGSDVMIWLDGLDLPIFQNIPVNFAEMYAEPRYPSAPAENSSLKFPWAPVQKALDSTGDASYASYTYNKPDGSPLSHIIGGAAERIGAKAASPEIRDTCSKIFHVYEGTGYSEIVDAKGNKTVLKWTNSDTFAVPAWSGITHHNEGDEAAYLFSYNDKPLLNNLNLFREQQKQ